MTPSSASPQKYTVYPGEYVPNRSLALLQAQLKGICPGGYCKPAMNVKEMGDCFKIELALPGVCREDIFVEAHEHFLSVIIPGHQSEPLMGGNWQVHEFDTQRMERHILLPEFADVEFASAEYRLGVLSLYISKSPQALKTSNNKIVVY
jgi:HSP20 family protein